MEPFMWLILLGGLGGGIALGFFIGQNRNSGSGKIKGLESELETTKKELDSYRDDVNNHFGKTALLFNQLTQDYRAMYEHLANGAETLTADQRSKLKSLAADPDVYERAVLEGENIAPLTEQPEVEAEQLAKASEAIEETEDKKSEEEIPPAQVQTMSEDESIEKKADDARTIH